MEHPIEIIGKSDFPFFVNPCIGDLPLQIVIFHRYVTNYHSQLIHHRGAPHLGPTWTTVASTTAASGAILEIPRVAFELGTRELVRKPGHDLDEKIGGGRRGELTYNAIGLW